MTNHEYLMGCQIGKIEPYLVVYDSIPIDKKIEDINNKSGNGLQYQDGYLFPEKLELIEDTLRVFYIDFEQMIDPFTNETHHKKHISTIIDIPYGKLTDADNKTRLIIISSTTNTSEVIQRYLLTIKANSYNYTKFPFDNYTLKKLFQNEELYTSIHEIKSTQRYLKFHYSGIKIISSTSDDIRLDPDFEHILDEEWKSIKIKLCREAVREIKTNCKDECFL